MDRRVLKGAPDATLSRKAPSRKALRAEGRPKKETQAWQSFFLVFCCITSTCASGQNLHVEVR